MKPCSSIHDPQLIFKRVNEPMFCFFDSSCPRLFAWKKTVSSLDDFNRGLLYILSRLLVLLYLYIATLSFFFQDALLNTVVGKSLLLFMAVYWIFRAFMQIQFYGFSRADQMNIKIADVNLPAPINRWSNYALSVAFFVIMLVRISLYLAPVIF